MTTTPDELIAERYAHLDAAAVTDPRIAHSMRFRRVSTRYPHQVAVAYDLDIIQAAADTDEQVAATVVAWELANGLAVTDWIAIGAEERDEVER